MKLSKPAGFTLIELLVALVVSGLLMATLVGISGAVQKSFSRSKDVAELQSNLRFAMKLLVQDFGRVGFMYSPNPSQVPVGTIPRDPRTGDCPLPAVFQPAITYTAGTGTLNLMGNFASSRDYLYDLDQQRILCRNGWDPIATPNCSVGNSTPDAYVIPFNDGPSFHDLFYPTVANQTKAVRVYVVGNGTYCYSLVNGLPNLANYGIALNPAIGRSANQGSLVWINPVNTVTYTITADPIYVPRYVGNPNNNMRWILRRSLDGNQPADIADFLLPPNDPQNPGLNVDCIVDLNGQIAGNPVQPNIQMQQFFNLIPQGSAQCTNPALARAVIITLRARTETEDPDFTNFNYSVPNSQAGNIGIDLDVNPTDGLAHVRTERTVVEMRNLSQ